MGWCERGACHCVALYRGERCEVPREMPQGMSSEFTGNFVFNRERIKDLPNLVLKYTTNPKVRRPVGLDTDIVGIRKKRTGELNSPVIRWLNKVLTVHSAVENVGPRLPTGAAAARRGCRTRGGVSPRVTECAPGGSSSVWSGDVRRRHVITFGHVIGRCPAGRTRS
eukprot:1188716-Prorocentrum_minimum.AAC.1